MSGFPDKKKRLYFFWKRVFFFQNFKINVDIFNKNWCQDSRQKNKTFIFFFFITRFFFAEFENKCQESCHFVRIRAFCLRLSGTDGPQHSSQRTGLGNSRAFESFQALRKCTVPGVEPTRGIHIYMLGSGRSIYYPKYVDSMYVCAFFNVRHVLPQRCTFFVLRLVTYWGALYITQELILKKMNMPPDEKFNALGMQNIHW